MGNNDPAQGGLTDTQIDWTSMFLNIDIRAATPSKPMKPLLDTMLDTAEAAMPAAAPNATATDLFFEKDSAKLTGSDVVSLDAYIKAYTEAQSTGKITVDAYASMEGDAGHNKQLAENRAGAVSDYLTQHGIPKDRVAATGHGRTDQFSQTDPSQNRRATLQPPPPARPEGQGSLGMRGHPNMQQEAGRAAQQVTDQHPATPAPGVPREEVEAALKKFLHDLAAAQGHKSAVKATARVVIAENTLRENIPGAHVIDRESDKDYDPDTLAGQIANALPDTIPQENYDKFLKLHAREAPSHGSITEDIRKKYQEERDKVVSELPKSIQKYASKAMDAGVPFAADQLMKDAGVNSTLESGMKDVVEKWTKKATGNDDGGDTK